MKTLIFIVGLFCCAGCDGQELYLAIHIIGQSNADGDGLVSDLPRLGLDGVYENVVTLSNGELVAMSHATDYVENGPQYFGLDLAIAKMLNTHAPNRRFVIVKRARGGTSLCRDWIWQTENPLRGLMAEEYRDQTDLSLALAQNVESRLVVWFQGESDAQNNACTAAYQANESDLINGIFATYGTDRTRFVIIGIQEPANQHANRVQVNQAKLLNTIKDKRVTFIPTHGVFDVQGDGVHLSSDGLFDLATVIVKTNIDSLRK